MNRIRELYRAHEEIILYLLIGALTTAVSLFVYYGLTLTVLDPQVPVQLQAANVVSWIAAVTFAYFTNRKYVFKSKNPNIAGEMLMFFAARLGSLLMEMGIMYVTVTVMGLNDKVMKLIAQIAVIVANYFISKLIVFRKKKE